MSDLLEIGAFKLLLGEPDLSLASVISDYFAKLDVVVDTYGSLEELDRRVVYESYDVAIIESTCGRRELLPYLRLWRSIGIQLPILVLSQQSLSEIELDFFKAGADDFLPKPFNVAVLYARICAILKRAAALRVRGLSEVYKVGTYTFDSRTQILKDGDIEKRLSTRENNLLRLLCANANQVVSKRELLSRIWGLTLFNSRSVDVYICKLRLLFKNQPNVQILNVHGTGYKLLLRQ